MVVDSCLQRGCIVGDAVALHAEIMHVDPLRHWGKRRNIRSNGCGGGDGLLVFHSKPALAAVRANLNPDGKPLLDIESTGSAQSGHLRQPAAAALDQDGDLAADDVLERDLMVRLGGIAEDEAVPRVYRTRSRP